MVLTPGRAPNADALAGGAAGAMPAGMRGEVSRLALLDGAAAVGGGAVGLFFSAAAIAVVVPSRPTMKLVLHFGQRIFIPLSGMRRSSTSYGDLHDTHSTLIMFLRAAFGED